jgi:hypothetical protein
MVAWAPKRHLVEDAEAVRAGFQEHRAGAVAKQDAVGAVGVVNDGRHFIGAHHNDLFISTGLDELRACSQGK